jgi:hypothetical protein
MYAAPRPACSTCRGPAAHAHAPARPRCAPCSRPRAGAPATPFPSTAVEPLHSHALLSPPAACPPGGEAVTRSESQPSSPGAPSAWLVRPGEFAVSPFSSLSSSLVASGEGLAHRGRFGQRDAAARVQRGQHGPARARFAARPLPRCGPVLAAVRPGVAGAPSWPAQSCVCSARFA